MTTTNELRFWTKVLHREGFEVVHQEEDALHQTLRFTVIPTLAVAVCPHCGRACSAVQQRRTRERVKDLPIGTQAVELKVRVAQFWCAVCERALTPQLPGIADGAHATERFWERAAALIRTGDIANAAAFFGVPEKTLERWYYDYVERQCQASAQPVQPLRSLGIDEISLKKSTASLSPS
jgi:transposase